MTWAWQMGSPEGLMKRQRQVSQVRGIGEAAGIDADSAVVDHDEFEIRAGEGLEAGAEFVGGAGGPVEEEVDADHVLFLGGAEGRCSLADADGFGDAVGDRGEGFRGVGRGGRRRLGRTRGCRPFGCCARRCRCRRCGCRPQWS